MFYHLALEHELQIHPRYFGPKLFEIIRSKLCHDVEGSCGSHGIVIAITSIDSVSMGALLIGSGFADFKVKYRAVVQKYFTGEVVEAAVTEVLKHGMFVEIGTISCFISHRNMPELKFDRSSHQPCYKSENEEIVIQKEDEIRVKIIGINMMPGMAVSDVSMIGSIEGDYLGLKITDGNVDSDSEEETEDKEPITDADSDDEEKDAVEESGDGDDEGREVEDLTVIRNGVEDEKLRESDSEEENKEPKDETVANKETEQKKESEKEAFFNDLEDEAHSDAPEEDIKKNRKRKRSEEDFESDLPAKKPKSQTYPEPASQPEIAVI